MTLRILIADDHSLFRDGMVSLLRAAGMNVVGEAGDGQEAIDEALRLKPDLVLLDINMPRGGGLEALRQIRKKLPDTKVVMLTVSDDDNNLVEAVTSGAQGYLLKSQDAKGFIASLDSLERGEAAISRKMTTHLMNAMAKGISPRDNESQAELFALLTDRESELLLLVAEGHSNKAIAEEMIVSENTVKYHMKNLLQKLQLRNRTEAAAYAVRIGLLKKGVQ